jgi:hypothetical protein
MVCKARNSTVMVALRSMRAHIAAHILRELVISNVCHFYGLHISTPVLRQAGESRAGSRQKSRAASDTTYKPTVVKLCARPNLYGKDKRRCTSCPAHCPICKTVV